MNCSICGQPCLSLTHRVYDDRYGYPGLYSIWACHHCQHRELHPKPPASALDEIYSRYYPRAKIDPHMHQPHQDIQGWRNWIDGMSSSAFRWVPQNVRILDIGCGTCQSLGYYRTRGCEAYGVDPDENIRIVADMFAYNVQTGAFSPTLYPSEYFDYVTLDQVIEHFLEPITTFMEIAQVLKPGGRIILSTPNPKGWGARIFGRNWINWHAPYHVHFFSTSSMELAASKAGFTVEKTFTATSSHWLHYQWLHLLAKPNPGTPSPFWSLSGNYSFPQKLTIKAVSLLHKSKVNHLITRFFDAINLGDNRLYFLRKP